MTYVLRGLKQILVDMDNVLSDLEKGFLLSFSQKYPDKTQISLSERNTFFPREQYVNQFGEEYRSYVDEIVYSEGFLLNLPEVRGSVSAVYNIIRLGHDVIVCTSPLKDITYCFTEKFRWIESRFGNKLASKMVFSSDKTFIRGDYLIDDRKEITGAFNPQWEHILFKRYPYNYESSVQKRMDWESDYVTLLSL